ncbi:MAG: DUF2975 domain-containing protein [Niabella sp.]|nr:DUF2975 domain-containing protein [Niabella sp.]
MKRSAVIFFQMVIVLVGIVVFVFLVRFPLTEGRAANLDGFRIYSDPFILYGYAASIAFFVALYKAFRLLGYIRQNKIVSSGAVSTLKSIKYCAMVLSVLIAAAGLYISVFHNKEDDPAGFLAICIAAIFISVVVAITASIFGKNLGKVMDKRFGNDLTN